MSNIAAYNAARHDAAVPRFTRILEALDRGDKWAVVMHEEGCGKHTIHRALKWRREVEGC